MAYRWDEFSLDVDGRRLVGGDGDIHLEPQVFDVLALLVAERVRVVSKTEILDAVWGDQYVSESALTTRIKFVRRALGDDGRTQKYIRNVHGRGYQFVGTLMPETASATVATAELSSGSLAADIAVDDEYPFVGRGTELEEIEQVLQSGRANNAKVFIGGAPGSGKSRLAIEVLSGAVAHRATACAGRCEANLTSSLQAVRDAFAQLAAKNRSELPRWSQGMEGQLLSLIPSLASDLAHDPIAVDAYAGIDVFLTVFERVAANGPLLLLVDDLQWSDDPTRVFLSRLHRRLPGRQLATITTFRSGRADLPDEVHAWIQGECRSTPSLRITLDNLDDAAATELIETVVGSATPSERERLVTTTGGHSLFLTESLRDMQLGQDSARSVGELVSRRLARQNENVQSIIEAAAILGPEFSFSIAAATAGLNPTAGLAAVDLAIDAELLHETSSASRFRFSHQLVPESIVENLSRSRRASLHAACAKALADEGADDVEIAFHTLGAIPLVPIDAAIEQSLAAASRARAANQFDRALRLLDAALTAEPQARVRAEILLELGTILNSKGTPGLAVAPLEQVIETSRTNGWPDLFLAATLAHWNRSPFRNPGDTTTLGLLNEARELVGGEDSVDKALVMAKTAVFNIFRQPLSVRATQVEHALEMATRTGATDAQRFALIEWCHITYSCPAGAGKLDALDVELERYQTQERQYFTDAAAPETSALMHGRGNELRRVTILDADRLNAQPIAEWRDLATGSMYAAFDGDIARARELCESAAGMGEAFWGESSLALHGFGHFFFDLVSNDWARSVPLLELLVAFAGSDIFHGALIAATHGSGDTEKARELLDGIDVDALQRMGEHIMGGNGLVGFAEAALRLDHDGLASAAESALAPYEELMLGVPWACSLAAADPLARLAARRGDTLSAERYTDLARSLYESLNAPYLLQRVAPESTSTR